MVERYRIAEVFVCRAGKFLILQRAGGRGKGYWMPPGGMIERGEEPDTAAARETLEETGLRIDRLQLLRRWSWQHPADAYVRQIWTYIATAPDGEVRLSVEHTAHEWTMPSEYAERFCSERLAEIAPEYAGMFREMRVNCTAVARHIDAF